MQQVRFKLTIDCIKYLLSVFPNFNGHVNGDSPGLTRRERTKNTAKQEKEIKQMCNEELT